MKLNTDALSNRWRTKIQAQYNDDDERYRLADRGEIWTAITDACDV